VANAGPTTTREEQFARARRTHFDVIVIGGGITGACAAWEASARGLSVLLLERGDFGGATSANSLKILHGGIRYLQHLDLARLRESNRERRAFLRMAPHLTRSQAFVVPTYGHGLQGKALFRGAFAALRLLTPDRNAGIVDPGRRIPGGSLLAAEDVTRKFPTIEAAGLTGAAVFHDGLMLNPPRLVFEIVGTARDAGACVLNYCNVVRICADSRDRSVDRVEAVCEISGQTFEFSTRSVINAAGPYAPWIETEEEPAAHRPRFSRDMAIVVDRLWDHDAALAAQTRYRDPDAILARGNRHLFMVPWRRYTLIGVHSRVYDEHPDALEVTDREIRDFLDEVNEAHPGFDLDPGRVRAVNAGLLPFGDNAAGAEHLSFGKRSLVRHHGAGGGMRGMVTAIAVRYTMGRATGREAVDLVERLLRGKVTGTDLDRRGIRGAGQPLRSALLQEIALDRAFSHLGADHVETIATCFGSDRARLRDVIAEDASMAEPIANTATIRGQVLLAARSEMATCLADIVLRRTDIGTGECPSDEILAECAGIAARELGWSPARVEREIAAVASGYPFYSSRLPERQLSAAS